MKLRAEPCDDFEHNCAVWCSFACEERAGASYSGCYHLIDLEYKCAACCPSPPVQHWIRLEMQPDMVINRLCMRIDPGDSSYTPSLVVLSAGESISTLKEIRTIHIPANETLVTLISDMSEVGFPLLCCRTLLCETTLKTQPK